MRRTVARPACTSPLAAPEQDETSERQRAGSLQIPGPAPCPSANDHHVPRFIGEPIDQRRNGGAFLLSQADLGLFDEAVDLGVRGASERKTAWFKSG